jgi:hypothetical protein
MNKGTKHKGFYVKTNESTHTKFKMACVKNGEKMTEVIEKLMLEYSKQ